ncbi:MAG: hypothetical protein ABIG34_01495 [Candidatus Peregrinibacteria bacterium]
MHPLLHLMRRMLATGTMIFLPTFGFFLATHWSTIASPWLGLDDYYVIVTNTEDVIRLFIGQGRPFYMPFILLQKGAFALFPSLEHASVFLHLIQAAIHTLTAVFVGLFLVRGTGRPLSFLAVIPFLFWPINEVAFWISTIGYTFAGLFSVIGVYLIYGKMAQGWRWLGVLLIVAAALTSQTACLTGLSMYIIALLLGWSQDDRTAGTRSFIWIMAAYVVGGAASALLAYFLSYRLTEVIFFSWGSAITIFSKSIRLLLIPDVFPIWLRQVQMIAFFLGPAAVIIHILIRLRSAISLLRGAAIALIMVLLLIIPLIPVYAIGGAGLPPRVLYAEPLSLTAALSLLLVFTSHRMFSAGVFLTLILALTIGYIPISAVSASEHVRTFQGDRQRLRMLEKEAQHRALTTVVIANMPERSTTPNPYHHQYYLGDSKKSAFAVWWSSDYFVRALSTSLQTTRDPPAMQHCTDYCRVAGFDSANVQDPRRLTAIFLPSKEQLLCYCP